MYFSHSIVTFTPALDITALDSYTLITCTRNSSVNIFFRLLTLSMTFLWSHEHTTGSTFLSIYYLFFHIFLYLLSCLPNKIIRRSFHSLEQGCPSPLRLTTRECSEATWTRRTRRRATTTAWGPSGAAASGERRKMSTYNPWSAYTAPKI